MKKACIQRSPHKKPTNRQSAAPLVSFRLECCYLIRKIYLIFLSGNHDFSLLGQMSFFCLGELEKLVEIISYI